MLTTINNTFGYTFGGAAIFHCDHNVLRDVSELTSQVTGVSRFQGRIRQTFSSTVSGREVLKNRQAFAEVRFNRRLDNFTRRFGHQATHTGQLSNLFNTTTSTRVSHEIYRIDVAHAATIILLHRFHHFLGDALTCVSPSIQHFVVSLLLGNHTTLVVLTELKDFLLGSTNEFLFGVRCNKIVGRKRKTTVGTFAETKLIHVVKKFNRFATSKCLVTVGNHNREVATLERVVVKVQAVGKHHVEHDTAVAGLDDLAWKSFFFVEANGSAFGQTDFDFCVKVDHAQRESCVGFVQ